MSPHLRRAWLLLPLRAAHFRSYNTAAAAAAAEAATAEAEATAQAPAAAKRPITDTLQMEIVAHA